MSTRGAKKAAKLEAALQVAFTETTVTGIRAKPTCELCLCDVDADRLTWPVRYEYTKPKLVHRTPLCRDCAKQLLRRRGSMGAVVERFCVFSLLMLVRSAADETHRIQAARELSPIAFKAAAAYATFRRLAAHDARLYLGTREADREAEGAPS